MLIITGYLAVQMIFPQGEFGFHYRPRAHHIHFFTLGVGSKQYLPGLRQSQFIRGNIPSIQYFTQRENIHMIHGYLPKPSFYVFLQPHESILAPFFPYHFRVMPEAQKYIGDERYH